MTPKLYVLDLPADRMEGEVAAAFYFEDERPLRGPAGLLDWRLDGRLTEMLLQGQATGRAGEHVLIVNNGKLGSGAALFCGAGSREGMGPDTYLGLVRHLLVTCRRAGFLRFALCLSLPQEIEPLEFKQRVTGMLDEMKDGNLECLLSFKKIGAERWLR